VKSQQRAVKKEGKREKGEGRKNRVIEVSEKNS